MSERMMTWRFVRQSMTQSQNEEKRPRDSPEGVSDDDAEVATSTSNEDRQHDALPEGNVRLDDLSMVRCCYGSRMLTINSTLARPRKLGVALE